MTIIRRAEFPTDSAAVLGIWRKFISNSPINLNYQNNEIEFATFTENMLLPGNAFYSQRQMARSRGASLCDKLSLPYVR